MPLELLAEIEKVCEERGYTVSDAKIRDEIKHKNLRQELFLAIKKDEYKGEEK